jgi:MSHA biogenesis protein MshG
MPAFRYKARGGRGDLIEGTMEGHSADAVAAQLINTGVIPIDIRPGGAENPLASFRARLTAHTPDLTDLVLFARQLYTLLKAGVPLNRGIAGLVRSTRNAALVEVLRDVQANIESGRELSQSLSRHPRVFSNLFVSMVRVGENSGRLDDALLRLSEYLDLDKDTHMRVKSALRYPSFVIIAIAIAVAVINIIVIPQFRNIFERAGVDLPLPTRVLIFTSDLFTSYWPHMLVVLAAAILGVRYYLQTDSGRYQWDKLKLNIPVVGSIIYRATLARFARAFALSLSAGVPLIQAMTIISKTVDNDFVGDRVLSMRNGIERGDSLARTAAASGMFSALVLQMLAVGEETGSIDTLMNDVAGFYEREVDYDIKHLSQAIEPLLIVVIAGMVLVLALGVFLPMWDLASVKLRG